MKRDISTGHEELRDGRVYLSELGELKFQPNNAPAVILYAPNDLAQALGIDGDPLVHLSPKALASRLRKMFYGNSGEGKDYWWSKHPAYAPADDSNDPGVITNSAVAIEEKDMREGFSMEEYCAYPQYPEYKRLDQECLVNAGSRYVQDDGTVAGRLRYPAGRELVYSVENLEDHDGDEDGIAVFDYHPHDIPRPRPWIESDEGTWRDRRAVLATLDADHSSMLPQQVDAGTTLVAREVTTQPQLHLTNPGDLPPAAMWSIVGGVGVVLLVALAAYTGFKAGRRARKARQMANKTPA